MRCPPRYFDVQDFSRSCAGACERPPTRSANTSDRPPAGSRGPPQSLDLCQLSVRRVLLLLLRGEIERQGAIAGGKSGVRHRRQGPEGSGASALRYRLAVHSNSDILMMPLGVTWKWCVLLQGKSVRISFSYCLYELNRWRRCCSPKTAT